MLDYGTTYPGQMDVDAAYPQGKARNVTASGAGDGTPWEAQLANDLIGFLQACIKDGSIIVSGAPETANASDVLTGLRSILVQRSELNGLGGANTVVTTRNKLPAFALAGFHMTRTSAVTMTTGPGDARDLIDTIDISRATSLTKTINVNWVEGAGGGKASAVALVPNSWIRAFTIGKPDGLGADLGWDTDPNAVNLLADAAGDGYTKFRRYGYTRIDGSSQIRDFTVDPGDARRVIWRQTVEAHQSASIGTGSRDTIGLDEGAAPSSIAIANHSIGSPNGSLLHVLITEASQTDVAATGTVNTLIIAGDNNSMALRGHWQLDSSSQLFARQSAGGNVDSYQVMVDGYIDLGVTA